MAVNINVNILGITNGCKAKCVKSKCKNAPYLDWVLALSTGGSADRSNAGFLRLNGGSPGFLASAFDSRSQQLNPANDFCFVARVRAPQGVASRVGLTNNPSGGSLINVDYNGTNWLINWFNGLGATTTTIVVANPNDWHIFKVCRDGSNITVQVDDAAVQTFAIDANYPTEPLTGLVVAGDGSGFGQTDISQFCLTF